MTETSPCPVCGRDVPLLDFGAGSRSTCSRSGPRCGRSPTTAKSNRPTTTPNAPLRSAVIYRKLSLGSQSDSGERRIERLLSAHTTCRLQRRSLHAYLIDAIGAHARGDPAPLLA
jgi:hypothetical protein